MPLLLYLVLGLTLFCGLVSFLFNGNFGRHVVSGLGILVHYSSPEKVSARREINFLQTEKDNLSRLQEEVSKRMEFDVDEAVAKMIEDMSSVRSFFAASSTDPVVSEEFSRINNLWEMTLSSWKNEKSKSTGRQYDRVLSGIEETNSHIDGLSREAGRPYREEVVRILQRLRQAQTQSASLSGQLEEKNSRIRELLSAASDRYEQEKDRQRSVVERQKAQLQQQSERNRQQQDRLRERMQRVRDKS